MGQKLEKPREGSLAYSLVLEREGKTAVKRINELAKVCDINMHMGGRLQAEEWRVLLKRKKGLLSDHGLLATAEAWYRVSQAVQVEGWSEQETNQHGYIVYVYHKPECTFESGRPPPYNGVRAQDRKPCPSATAPSLDPPTRHRPKVPPPSAPMAPPKGSGHLATPNTGDTGRLPMTASCDGHIGTPIPICPVLDQTGAYYKEGVNPLMMLEGDEDEAEESSDSHCHSPEHQEVSVTKGGVAPTGTTPSSASHEGQGPAQIIVSGGLSDVNTRTTTLPYQGHEPVHPPLQSPHRALQEFCIESDRVTSSHPNPTSTAARPTSAGPWGAAQATRVGARYSLPLYSPPHSQPFSEDTANVSGGPTGDSHDTIQYGPPPQNRGLPLQPPQQGNYWRLPPSGSQPHIPRGEMPPAPLGAPLMYVTFSPQQASSLVTSLPDPEKQPMPFYRRVAQIQKAYSCAWRDLVSLCEIKAGDAYWPVMLRCFKVDSGIPDNTYGSGCEFVTQLQQWARDRLADQATNIQDITQDKAESVEKFHTRMLQVFTDLGFSTQNKAHTQMLSSAFVTGLRDAIRKGLLLSRPEYRVLPLDTLLLVAKGIESSQGNRKAVPLMLTSDTPYPPPQTRNPRACCYNCGKPGHFRRQCRSPWRSDRRQPDHGDQRRGDAQHQGQNVQGNPNSAPNDWPPPPLFGHMDP